MVSWLQFSKPSTNVPAPVRPSLTLFFWLVGSLILTLLPHASVFPVWISVVIIGALIVRSVLEYYRLPMPSTAFTSLLAFCLLVAIYLQFHTLFGREAGTAFMAGLMTIKFYELRGPRDVAIIIFCSLFVVMSALLYSQALELFIYCLIMMWLLTGSLLRASMGDYPDNQLLRMLSHSGTLYLQAMPLAVVLFFLLPRYDGKIQMYLNDSPLGLTDKVEPGSITKLADDDSPAMYVKFTQGNVPTTDTMYWRALVLWEYHDGAWTPGFLGNVLADLPSAAPGSSPIEQEITIFPHNRKWIFALDHPITPAIRISENAQWSDLLSGGILQLGRYNGVVDHKDRYTVTSSIWLAEQTLSPTEKDLGSRLPRTNEKDAIDPRVIALADQLYAENPTTLGYIGSVYHYFRHFEYTTAPGNSQGDWLPDFLFVKKRGFCEHFASAFAVLMRLEHIPARVVVGYLGAEYNPYDGLYTVRQSNAHAWDEVWIESKKQWVRIDPSSVLPQSLDGASSAAASQNNEDTSSSFSHKHTSFSEKYFPEWMRHAMDDVQMRRQQIEANWDDWVFSYDPEVQSRFAQWLGLGKNNTVSLLVVCLLVVLATIFFFRKRLTWRKPLHPIETFYSTFCRRMAQRGLPRATWEGPLAYTDRLAEAIPEQKDAIHDAGELVARHRYGPQSTDIVSPKDLQALLNRLTAAQAAASSHE